MTEEGMSDVYAIGTEALRLHSQQTSIGEWDYDNAAAAVIDALSAAGVLGGVPDEVDDLRGELERLREETGLMPCPFGCGCRLGTTDADPADCACDGPCCWDDLTEWVKHQPEAATRLLGGVPGEKVTVDRDLLDAAKDVKPCVRSPGMTYCVPCMSPVPCPVDRLIAAL